MKSSYLNFVAEPGQGSNLNSGNLSFLGLFTGDRREDAERQKVLDEVRAKMGVLTDCATAVEKLNWLKGELESVTKAIAAGTTDRVGKRYQAAYNVLIDEINQYILQNCSVAAKSTETAQTVQQAIETIGAGTTDQATAQAILPTGVKNTTTAPTTTLPLPTTANKNYLKYGLIAAAVLIGGVIIWKVVKS